MAVTWVTGGCERGHRRGSEPVERFFSPRTGGAPLLAAFWQGAAQRSREGEHFRYYTCMVRVNDGEIMRRSTIPLDASPPLRKNPKGRGTPYITCLRAERGVASLLLRLCAVVVPGSFQCPSRRWRGVGLPASRCGVLRLSRSSPAVRAIRCRRLSRRFRLRYSDA